MLEIDIGGMCENSSDSRGSILEAIGSKQYIIL
jgi:hypothetical protein